jgi:mono/diheme cytochrome c family protein
MGKKVGRIYFAIVVIISCTSNSSLGQSISESSSPVTEVRGESWLKHLHRTFDETSMGKTGRLGPPDLVQQPSRLAVGASQTVTLSGADVYRLNCRGCHGEFGAGAPPEINSVINPVRATSVAAIMARLKTAGANVSRADATRLAEQSKSMLLQRLHNGGEDMPAFPQLSAADIKVLTGYLKQLAEVPGAEHGSVQASPLRVGELIVKSTCHTCHSATGENPTPRELSDGAIPPLSTLTSRVSRAEFVRKVTQGAPVVMGEPALLYRGRMPVFYYLSEEEAADVYEYLVEYPPAASDTNDPVIALSQDQSVAGSDFPKVAAPDRNKTAIAPTENVAVQRSIVLPVAGLLIILLMGGGMAITVREMRKLASLPVASARLGKDHPRKPVASMERDMVA